MWRRLSSLRSPFRSPTTRSEPFDWHFDCANTHALVVTGYRAQRTRDAKVSKRISDRA